MKYSCYVWVPESCGDNTWVPENIGSVGVGVVGVTVLVETEGRKISGYENTRVCGRRSTNSKNE